MDELAKAKCINCDKWVVTKRSITATGDTVFICKECWKRLDNSKSNDKVNT